MKKNLNKLATLALTGILMTGMSFGALAGDKPTDGVVATATSNTLEVTKELGVIDVDSDYVATAPHVKFTYAVTAAAENQLGTVGDMDTENNDQTPRKAGVIKKTNGKQTAPTASEVEVKTTDTVTDKKVKKTITVDFSGIGSDDWKVGGAGVYRYVLTETDEFKVGEGDDVYDYTQAMVKTDNDNTRYIDVYVGNIEDGSLGIVGYVVSKTTADGGKTDGYEVEIETKDGTTTTTGDVYKTYDLKVTKTVTGTLGDKTKDFAFTTKDFKLPDGATYGYESTNTNDATTSIETTSVTSDLKDGQNFTIKGIPVGEEMTVEETDYTKDGYKTYTAVGSNEYEKNENRNVKAGDNNVANSATTVNFKNEKNDTTPTGVVMNIAPYVAMILGAGAFAGVFLGRKKSEDGE